MRFVGSKGNSGLWQRIISEMPPHEVYCEAFLGTGWIMKHKKPAALNIGIDLDDRAPAFSTMLGVPNFRPIIADAITELKTLRPAMSEARWLVYADPPYPGFVRRDKTRRYYRHELKSPDDHIRLLTVLNLLPAYVILSGYRNPLYDEALAGWRTVTVKTVTRGGKHSEETLWLNYPAPFAFHDTRYLGRNFRERERIKRKKHRWVRRLSTMSVIDRVAILEAIDEAAGISALAGPGDTDRKGRGVTAPFYNIH